MRARTEIVEDKNGRFKIIVSELPYQVNKARLHESIADLVKDKRIEGISNVEDHSDRDGMCMVVDIKRDASPQVVLNQLFSYTQMQTTFGVIMLAIVGGQPKILTLKEMLEEYIRFQEEVVTRRTRFDLRKAQERAHILEGLKIALDFIDEVIEILRASKTPAEGRQALMERFAWMKCSRRRLSRCGWPSSRVWNARKLRTNWQSWEERLQIMRISLPAGRGFWAL